ncbi:sensor histidine kinase [Actinomadura atramentaria]|uniref:sensor histidine kinase n=1 Tax=Actinomadura atramentaria TaxID=1990 RepID=UPI00036E0A25|nr:ATP-binding protein [Actinomadura atramentaria]
MSVRTRLTLVYGTLFLASAGLLVGVTYALTVRALDGAFGAHPIQTIVRVQNGPDGPQSEIGARLDTSDLRYRVDDQVTAAIGRQKHAALQEILQSTAVLLVALCALAVVIGYVVAGRVLRPLHTMTERARRLSGSTLHERFALDGPQDEIKDLADTFDGMLDRLHRAFDAQRRFTANASHELRTPLTINRTVLEVALASRRNPPETKALAEVLLGNTARHERLIEGLLLLATSEREPQETTAVTLPDVVQGALDQAGIPENITLDADLADAPVEGDPVLLERCAANLIENAVKYNVADGRVEITTGREDGMSVLRVANTGNPVPPYEVARLFEPFRRLRGDRVRSADGAGLGLSIVAAVAAAHGGRADARPRPGGGLVVTVALPAPSG